VVAGCGERHHHAGHHQSRAEGPDPSRWRIHQRGGAASLPALAPSGRDVRTEWSESRSNQDVHGTPVYAVLSAHQRARY
jgi:hypothetical protein